MNEAIHARNWARRCRSLAEGALSGRISDELLQMANEFEVEAFRSEWGAPTTTRHAA
jgi:hypothetical protein